MQKDFRKVLCPHRWITLAFILRVVYKKGDTCQIMNYMPISILSALSKICERIISEQINKFMADMLSPLLSEFRQGYSTQHARLRVEGKWKKHLDMMGIVGTILMDLSKAYEVVSLCIPPRSIDSEIRSIWIQ